LQGRPLIAHVGDVMRGVSMADRVVASTDSDEIARVAKDSGIDVPFYRPESLSGDRIGDWDVLVHALNECEALDQKQYDVVVMLQPTSPLRKPEHVIAVIEKLISENLDAVWTVSPTDLKYHPLKQLTVNEAGHMEHFMPEGRNIIARQQLKPVYHRNGAAYAISRECLLTHKSIIGKKTGAIILHEPMISIDTIEDFEKVEKQMIL